VKRTDFWTFVNIPPKGDDDVGEFHYDLFEIAAKERARLEVNKTAFRNYGQYRGQRQDGGLNQANDYPANLYFANIERTVSNITARDPEGEVVDLDGKTDDAEKILSAALKKWWKDTDQRAKIRLSAKYMEIYGITAEKPFIDFDRKNPVDIELVDMFGFYPAPGNWDNLDEQAPFICFAYSDFIDSIEKYHGVKGVLADEAYDILGNEREKYRSSSSAHEVGGLGRYADPMRTVTDARNIPDDKKLERGLIIEVWIRDTRMKTEDGEVVEDPETGEFVLQKEEVPIYPDGIRKVTVTRSNSKEDSGKNGKNGYIVLDDSANPNINPKMDPKQAKLTHPWGRLPVYVANSYKDPVTIWGFAAAEQTGALLYAINQILKKLVNWVKNVMTPPLIIQKHCGITRAMIENDNEQAGRLVLMPSIPNARIEFMQIPNLPQTFFVVLDKLISLHDRIHAIEEADRGEAPNGVISGKGIAALQEKNQVALQPKTVSIESLAENRSKWAIGLWQNWGTDTDMVNVGGEPTKFVGVEYSGRRFNFVVESGSTTPRTSLQNQELIMELADKDRVSTPYLLEILNVPNWKEEVARTSGPMVGQAMKVLTDAGLPPEIVEQLYAELEQVMTEEEGENIYNGPGEGSKPKSKPKGNGGTANAV